MTIGMPLATKRHGITDVESNSSRKSLIRQAEFNKAVMYHSFAMQSFGMVGA